MQLSQQQQQQFRFQQQQQLRQRQQRQQCGYEETEASKFSQKGIKILTFKEWEEQIFPQEKEQSVESQGQQQAQQIKKQKRLSRRIAQKRKAQFQKVIEREKKREAKEKDRPLEIQLNTSKTIKTTIVRDGNQKCLESYGFIGDPEVPLWKNIEDVLGNMTKFEYFNRPQQMAYHNLCSEKQPLQGIGITLGLGLKFCIQTKLPPSNLKSSFERFIQDIRKRYTFAGRIGDDTPKKIYIKSTTKFSPSEDHFEERIENFIRTLEHKKLRHLENSKPSTNLTKLQQQQLNLLRNNQDFIILNADKNLGPCILERDIYIKMVLREHLQSDTYQNLDEAVALEAITNLRTNLVAILKANEKKLPSAENDYFIKSLKTTNHRIPQFYGMPKVHKNKIPIPLRPVVSQCGSLSAIVSTYIDFKLQPFTKKLPSYTKNSTSLLNNIDRLPNLPKSAKIFTSDATSMYTNIDPEEGIETVRSYLSTYNKEIKEQVDVSYICDLLYLVMNNNIFKFGNTWWKQLVGTAMGTPCACIYATLFFGWFERQFILTKYKNNLLFYKRQIDDIFGVWVEDSRYPDRWEEFKQDLNNYCKLDWNTEELSTSVNFLDLTIEIDKDKGKLTYKTYQKPMNLFLYIPGHSAHPPGIVKSLIHGLVHTYHRQNSNKEDFQRNVKLLFGRLLVRGHHHNDIYPIFVDAAASIDAKQQKRRLRNRSSSTRVIQSKQQSYVDRDDIFFHLPYHPRDITRKTIQSIYNDTCNSEDAMGESFKGMTNWEGGRMEISKLTVAYSRGKNLRDMLCSSALKEHDTCQVSQFL
jgi:hypothetical protein